MIQNLLVMGIGGSGNKALRAFIHLCAMGLGPENIDVFMIDIDQNNGDVELTKDTIIQYQTIKKRLVGNTEYFKSNINLKSEIPWSPFDNYGLRGSLTLGNYLNLIPLSEDIKRLIPLFFTSDELTVPLEGGCKAHPNIGAFLMATIFSDKKFEDMLIQHFTKQNSAIYLFNSIFGGTGASGGPVIVNGINKYFAQALNGITYKRIPIGMSVLLPYFIIPKSTDDEEKLKIQSQTFDANAAAALPYYKTSVPADVIYFAGDHVKASYKNYASGKKAQLNPAHLLELYSGIFAIDFCNSNFDMEIRVNTRFNLITFGNEDNDDYSIELLDIPNINGVNLKNRIVNLQILSNTYKYFYSLKDKIPLTRFSWFTEISDYKNIKSSDNFFDDLKTYFNLYDCWMEQMTINNARLKYFNNLERIDNIIQGKPVQEVSDIDQINKYFNIPKLKNKRNEYSDFIEICNNGINYFMDKSKVLN